MERKLAREGFQGEAACVRVCVCVRARALNVPRGFTHNNQTKQGGSMECSKWAQAVRRSGMEGRRLDGPSGSRAVRVGAPIFKHTRSSPTVASTASTAISTAASSTSTSGCSGATGAAAARARGGGRLHVWLTGSGRGGRHPVRDPAHMAAHGRMGRCGRPLWRLRGVGGGQAWRGGGLPREAPTRPP